MEIWIQEGFRIKRTIAIIGVNRSMYYYHQSNQEETNFPPTKRGRPYPGFSHTKEGKKICDEQIEEWLMEAVEGDEGAYGYKKLTNYLRVEYNLIINPKKVRRLCHELGILSPARRAPSMYPRKMARNHTITGPNQLWQLDIKYGSIEESGRFFFLASVIDVFDRSIVGYFRGSSCKAKDITKMLKEALQKRNVEIAEKKTNDHFSVILRTDNGPQFLSKEFGEFCIDFNIYHERIPPKSPNLNAFIESFHSIIERECYQRYPFECFEEAYYWIDHFISFYNERRYHGSLNYLPPAEYLRKYLKEGCSSDMVVNL